MTKQQLREAIRSIIRRELNEGPYSPSIADPDTEEDVEVGEPLISPDEDDLSIGNPHTKPDNVPAKAEEDILKKIIARYKASLNEKKYK